MDSDPRVQPKILVIDHSRMVRMTAQKILRAEFQVIEADSGESGWSRINADPEILTVFCNLAMPGIDGYELLRLIRSDERELIARLPVIIVTGNEEDSAREKALEQGATDFITKPFDAAQLLARARAHANHDRLRRQAAALKKSSTQDSITGLGNARYFATRLRSTRAYSLRHDLPMALIRVHLIGLHSQVDEHGRRAVALALRSSGQILSHWIREEDVLVHLAPGRFAVVCSNCGVAGAERLAERLVASLLENEEGPAGLGLGAAACVHVPDNEPTTSLQAIHQAAQRLADTAVARGSGSVVVGDREAEAAQSEPPPSVDEALNRIATHDGGASLQDHLPALLERCAALFESAPPEIARPILDRLNERIARPPSAEGGAR